MIVYKDVFSGDEMFSDAFTPQVVEGVAYEIEAKFVQKTEGGDYGIGGEEGEVDTTEGVTTVINLVDNHNLQPTPFDKKTFMMFIKGYMKKLKAYLEENHPERVAGFMKEIQPFVKKLLGMFKDLEFYTGESMDPEAGVGILFYKEDGQTPYFYFFKDGLEVEKY